MQYYQFEKIYSRMSKEFGKMKKGQEDDYAMLLFPMEYNALITFRAFPASGSKRLNEAIALVLFDIRDRCTGEHSDTSAFRNADNERLENALLMAFDPYTNENVMEAVESKYNTRELTQEMLKDYYKVPCMCLLRIKDSVDLWDSELGINGYFTFTERTMGHMIKDDEMKFSVGM